MSLPRRGTSTPSRHAVASVWLEHGLPPRARAGLPRRGGWIRDRAPARLTLPPCWARHRNPLGMMAPVATMACLHVELRMLISPERRAVAYMRTRRLRSLL